MTYLQPTEDQRLAVESFRKFLEAEIRPFARKYIDRFIPKEDMLQITPALAEFGLPGAAVPAEHGGLGLGMVTQAMLLEELMTVSVDLGLFMMINTGTARFIATMAPDHLREKYLPGLLAGTTFGSFAISEPDVGSNVAEIKTRAVRDGDHFVISGEKTWITGGHYSDFIICTTRTGEKELSHFLIDREEHGYETRNIDKIALNSQSTAQIFISDARVPESNIIGGLGTGLKNTVKEFESARPHVGLLSVGLMRAALEESIAYAKERKQFGKVIAAHQLIAAKIAEMATMVDASKLMCYRALSLIDAGVRCDLESSMAKWFATEAAVKVCRDAVQLHGGNGLTKEFNVERLAREAIVIPVPDGTTDIQKLIIARGLTGISAFN
ncbi:MAG: acyl-CoA/acyl-ACP dehydrogenase [Sphingopyxis sp.]|nr:acyl-CoA/acyl-ACP dehydrogenase [Sphingopyxis sp.]